MKRKCNDTDGTETPSLPDISRHSVLKRSLNCTEETSSKRKCTTFTPTVHPQFIVQPKDDKPDDKSFYKRDDDDDYDMSYAKTCRSQQQQFHPYHFSYLYTIQYTALTTFVM